LLSVFVVIIWLLLQHLVLSVQVVGSAEETESDVSLRFTNEDEKVAVAVAALLAVE
jgi:hypothetical protein